MKRWENRSQTALADLPRSDFNDVIDFLLAYFLWSHSLRDWLINDGVFSKDDLNARLGHYKIWALCCDVANRTRHYELTRNPTDKDWSAYREYDPFGPLTQGREVHLANIMFDGEKWRVADAIRASANMWEEIVPIKNFD
jgi:hypothetical protein